MASDAAGLADGGRRPLRGQGAKGGRFFGRGVARFAPGFLFVAGFLAYLAVFYPGFMSNDSVNQILEARRGVYTDWHPPAMAHLWRVVEYAIPGPTGMLVLQSALVWFGMYLIHRAFFAARCGLTGAVCLFALPFFPPLFGIAGVIWKDILMWGILLLAIGVAGHVRRFQEGDRWRPATLLAATVSLSLAAVLIRHNALIAAIPVMGLAIFRFWDGKRLAKGAAALVAAAVLGGLLQLSAGAANAYLTDRKTSVWVALAVFDIAGVIVRLPDETARRALYMQLPAALRQNGTPEAVVKNYTPVYWETLFRGDSPAFRPVGWERLESFSYLSDEELSDIRKLWFSVNRRYWREWLSHRLAVSRHLLGVLPERLWAPAYMKTNGFSEVFEPYYGRNPEPNALQRGLEKRLTSLDLLWMYRPWFYLLLSGAILLLSVARARRGGLDAVFISLSGLFHEGALLFVAPSPDFRYSHYLIFATLLSMLLLLRPSAERPQAPPAASL